MNAKEFRAKLIKEEIEERFEHLKSMVDKATDEGMREYKVKGYITLETNDSDKLLISRLSKIGLKDTEIMDILDTAKIKMINYLNDEGWNYAENDGIPTVSL